MKNIGVICEYNPFHRGHEKQLAAMGEDKGRICLMSGSYVQRGEPAILNKYVRAKAAVACGADLVLELPVTYSLRSAEGFAAGGVEILSALGCVEELCFGSEAGDPRGLMELAALLLSEEFRQRLKLALAQGDSFPKAREKAVADLGGRAELLKNPNDILGVEYCKALLRQNSKIKPLVLKRQGSYHESLDPENPSATMLRGREDWWDFVPEKAMAAYAGAERYSLRAGERAWLGRLRAMGEEEFARLPFGSEGLWRKVMQACRRNCSLEEIIEDAKSKRYTRTRIMRMLLCSYLGISQELMEKQTPYVRILAINERGREILHQAKKRTAIPLLHPGERGREREFAELERRCADLYGLFCENQILPAGRGEKERLLRL